MMVKTTVLVTLLHLILLNNKFFWNQLRGLADKRQLPTVNYALQHNLGLGGAVVVAIYAEGFKDAVTGIEKNF